MSPPGIGVGVGIGVSVRPDDTAPPPDDTFYALLENSIGYIMLENDAGLLLLESAP